jgi:hypothetical protein
MVHCGIILLFCCCIKMLAFIFLTAVYALYFSLVLGVEIIQVEDVAPSSQGKVYVKGGQSKPKIGKRHGYIMLITFFVFDNIVVIYITE